MFIIQLSVKNIELIKICSSTLTIIHVHQCIYDKRNSQVSFYVNWVWHHQIIMCSPWFFFLIFFFFTSMKVSTDRFASEIEEKMPSGCKYNDVTKLLPYITRQLRTALRSCIYILLFSPCYLVILFEIWPRVLIGIRSKKNAISYHMRYSASALSFTDFHSDPRWYNL